MTNKGERPNRPAKKAGTSMGADQLVFRQGETVMRAQSSHWLDYDPVALVILVVGIGAVALLALSI